MSKFPNKKELDFIFIISESDSFTNLTNRMLSKEMKTSDPPVSILIALRIRNEKSKTFD